jgi:hypothetical protein
MESPSEQQHAGPTAIGQDVPAEELEIERDDRRMEQIAKIEELRSALKLGDAATLAGKQLVQGRWSQSDMEGISLSDPCLALL